MTLGEAVLTLMRECRSDKRTKKGLREVIKALESIDGIEPDERLRILQRLEYVAHDNPTFGTQAGDAYKGYEEFQSKIDKLIGRIAVKATP